MLARDFSAARERMVDRQVAARGVRDSRVLAAMRAVPREWFVAEGLEEFAYEDSPLPIGHGQTISQPYIVALMIAAADLSPEHRVLEVGAGSGYAAAVIGQIARRVIAIERHDALARRAKARMRALGYGNVAIRLGDGTHGAPDHAPFDAILVAARSVEVPLALRDQLAVGGRLVIPIGGDQAQTLRKIVRVTEQDYTTQDLGQVVFVPLVSDRGEPDRARAAIGEQSPAPDFLLPNVKRQRMTMTAQDPATEIAKDAAADKAPNPRRHYDSPEALRDDDALDLEAKQQLLTEWKQDLEQRIEAEAEGMSAADPISSEKESRLAAELRKVSAALEDITSQRGG